MMFQFLSYGNFTNNEREEVKQDNEKCISYSQMEPDVNAFIKRIIRALGIPFYTLKNFMGVYGIFSASIPNVDNNALYGGIKVSARRLIGHCDISMYHFKVGSAEVKTVSCNVTSCAVHVEIIEWINDTKRNLDTAVRQDATNIVARFLRMFLIIFEIDILGIGGTEHQAAMKADINAEYATMAIEFKSHMERSLRRGQRWTSRSRR